MPLPRRLRSRRLPPVAWLAALALAGAGLAGLLAGCSTQTKQRWLRTFFDGVDKPRATRTNAVVLDEDGRALNLAPFASAPTPAYKGSAFFRHPPFEERKCFECHESQFSVRMKGPEPEVCFACHDDFLKTAKVKHAPAATRCSDCHNAHGSGHKAFLLGAGEFSMGDFADTPALAAKLKAGADPVSAFLSRSLPDATRQAVAGFDGAETNRPGLQRDLLAAFNRLASRGTLYDSQRFADVTLRPETQELLAQQGDGVSAARLNRHLLEDAYPAELTRASGARSATNFCFQCHDDFLVRAKVRHQPVESDGCASCHLPHASAFPALLKKSPKDTCAECHDNVPGKAKVKHQPVEGGECAACHDPHAAAHKHLVKKPGAALCWDCHDDFLAGAKVKHQPAESGECGGCHKPHAADLKGLLVKGGAALCWDCHDDFLAGAKVKHQPAESGECGGCHKPHAAEFKGLLAKSVKATCAECHEDVPGKARVIHSPVESGDCLSCHDPHVAKEKKLLKKAGAAACWECHDDFLKDAKFKHQPAAEGDCAACHKAHAADWKALLPQPDPQLCYECHEEADVARVDAHKTDPKAGCVKCHNPHAGGDKLFLTPEGQKAATKK